jgi:hypothetical protein
LTSPATIRCACSAVRRPGYPFEVLYPVVGSVTVDVVHDQPVRMTSLKEGVCNKLVNVAPFDVGIVIELNSTISFLPG